MCLKEVCYEKLHYELRLYKLLQYLHFSINIILKLVSAIFYQIFIFLQSIALQKLEKMYLILSKKLFSFLR